MKKRRFRATGSERIGAEPFHRKTCRALFDKANCAQTSRPTTRRRRAPNSRTTRNRQRHRPRVTSARETAGRTGSAAAGTARNQSQMSAKAKRQLDSRRASRMTCATGQKGGQTTAAAGRAAARAAGQAAGRQQGQSGEEGQKSQSGQPSGQPGQQAGQQGQGWPVRRPASRQQPEYARRFAGRRRAAGPARSAAWAAGQRCATSPTRYAAPPTTCAARTPDRQVLAVRRHSIDSVNSNSSCRAARQKADAGAGDNRQLEARQLADQQRQLATESARQRDGQAGSDTCAGSPVSRIDSLSAWSACRKGCVSRARQLAHRPKRCGRSLWLGRPKMQQAASDAAKDIQNQRLTERMQQAA